MSSNLADLSPFIEDSQSADARSVQSLFGTPGDVTSQDLIGTGFSYRHDWGNRRGQHVLRLNIGSVNQRSRVFVSIGEGAAGGPNGGKHMGAARFTVHNVVPRAGGIDIWINIEWGSDLRIYADYLVVNP